MRALLVALLALGGCGPEPAQLRGQRLFSDPAFSSSPSNPFACATCHATAPGGDPARILPGYVLHDVVGRPSWWGGAYTRLLDAVNQCYVQFMRGEALTPEDVDGRALLVYLESISPSPAAPALPLTIVRNIVDVPSGDAARGAEVYRRGCAYCHGDAGSGRGRLGPRVTVIPDETIKMFPNDARLITIEKIRHGKYYNVGGNMAPFSLEALSNEDVGHLLASLFR